MHAGFLVFFFAPILIAHTQWRNRFFRSEKWPFYSSLPIVSVLKCWTYRTFVVAVLFSVLKDQCDGFYYCRGGNTRAFFCLGCSREWYRRLCVVICKDRVTKPNLTCRLLRLALRRTAREYSPKSFFHSSRVSQVSSFQSNL
jgi:hypothetical protein